MSATGGAHRESWTALPYDGAFRSVPCAEAFSPDEYAQLQKGLVPEVMEDKWFVFFEAPFLYFHRSWTRELVYRVRFDASVRGARVAEALASGHTSLVHGPEWEGALVAFLLRGLVLGQRVSFPLPPGGAPGPAGLFQHVVSGTGFPEAEHHPAPPGLRAAVRRFWRRLTWRPRG